MISTKTLISTKIYATGLKHDARLVKMERERINDELDRIDHVTNIHEYDVTVYLKDVRKIVRGELR
jgi:hypothetical protein